jgi:aspartyl-tRNA(Asn)/glutamyl-tRNA(Gln) amidotransferase subunit B
MPELPDIKRTKYKNLGISREQADVLISDRTLSTFLDDVSKHIDDEQVKTAANYILTDLAPRVADGSVSMTERSVEPFSKLMAMVSDGKVTSRVAKDMLSEVLNSAVDPMTLAEERGLLQDNSEETLLAVVSQIITENQSVVDEYKAGKDASIQYLIGQAMKMTKGAANPSTLKTLFEKELKK